MNPRGQAAPFIPTIKIQYPEYSVTTPQTNQSFTVRSLNVQDEETLKGSILSTNKLPQHLNNVVWSCIVKKPGNINDYPTFIKNTTPRDREALLFGIYHITFKDINDYEITCDQCENKYPVKVDISQTFSMDAYEDQKNPILTKEVNIVCPVAKGITATIKQPSLEDEEALMENIMFQSKKNLDLGVELLAIKRFSIVNSDAPQQPPQVVEQMEDMFHIYKQLPSMDRKALNKAYIDAFGKYGIELQMTSRCGSCGKENDTKIDLVTQFFRSLYE